VPSEPRQSLAERRKREAAGEVLRGVPPKLPPPDAADLIRVAAAGGASLKGVAAAVGCNVDTLHRWLDAVPELREAIDAGREQERRTLHNVLYRAATEGSGKDALIAAMFLLKARHGYREGDQQEQANRVNITFNMPAAQPLADFIEVSNADGTEVQRLPAKAARAPRRS
jgi:hypothetical protein